MKTKHSLLPAATTLLATLISLGAAHRLPAQPTVDPATGLPVPGSPKGMAVNPATDTIPAPPAGMPQPDPTVLAVAEVHQLIANGQYDEALKHCLAFQTQLKGDQNLPPLVDDWVELGRRFPQAREALLKIRDHDAAEFAAGRGYAVLFSELKAINGGWNEEDATYALFKTIHKKDRRLARQCYGDAEDLLVTKGEYALCLECLGDPRARFESSRAAFQRTTEMQQRQDAWQNDLRQRQEELAKSSHFPVPPMRSIPGPYSLGGMATNHFVGTVLKLEKILAGAGRLDEAAIIRDQALALVADDRFKSVITDAQLK